MFVWCNLSYLHVASSLKVANAYSLPNLNVFGYSYRFLHGFYSSPFFHAIHPCFSGSSSCSKYSVCSIVLRVLNKGDDDDDILPATCRGLPCFQSCSETWYHLTLWGRARVLELATFLKSDLIVLILYWLCGLAMVCLSLSGSATSQTHPFRFYYRPDWLDFYARSIMSVTRSYSKIIRSYWSAS